MGAQSSDPDGPIYDPMAEPDESPVRKIMLRPFLIGKHECTQAQWAAMAEGARPSLYGPGSIVGERRVTDRNPVDSVSWGEMTMWLSRHLLRLPSEAEWEYACRAGTSTPFFTGTEIVGLVGVANMADAYCKANGGPPTWKYTEEIDDGHTVHAPVGTFRANGFGLHEVHGNQWEFCADWSGKYEHAPTDGTARTGKGGAGGRALRGGGFVGEVRGCRSAYRAAAQPTVRDHSLGFRAAASLP